MRVFGGHQPHVYAGVEYFARLDACDVWVFSDDVKFVQKDWQNRNRIKAPFGAQWITVPVTGSDDEKIFEKKIAPNAKLPNLWKTIEQSYAKCPHWKDLAWLEPLFLAQPLRLVDLARPMMEQFVEYLGISTELHWATDLGIEAEEPSVKIAMQGEHLEANVYACGRAASAYLDPAPFRVRGIGLRSFVWSPPEYRQRWTKDGFAENLSIIDLVANEGPNSLEILRGGMKIGDGEWGTLDRQKGPRRI